MKKISFLFLASLFFTFTSCTNETPPTDETPTEDTTAPTVEDSTLTYPNHDFNSITVVWSHADDETTERADLEYRLLYSTTDNIATVEDAEANGTEAHSYEADITGATVTSLSGGTSYFFNVIVRDEAGNKTAYTSSSHSTSCFLGDTLITMADGTKKRIDEIKVGDMVRSFNKKGMVSSSKIEKVLTRDVKEYINLVAGTLKVSATSEHPFYTGSKDRQNKKYPGFRNLGNVKQGDTLYSEGTGESSLQKVTVTSTTKVEAATKVYNLHLGKGPKTYFANGFAVHNK